MSGARSDWRLKCACCRGWMRFKPTPKTPLKRRPSPHANVCVLCKPGTFAFRSEHVRCKVRGCNAIDALAGLCD